MKAVRKLSTSIHNVGNMITNKISDVKTKGGTQLKLQVICPADGYPGKQITIAPFITPAVKRESIAVFILPLP